jgi:hypothetical protein
MEEQANLFSDLGWEEGGEIYPGAKKKVLRDEGGAKTILLSLPDNFRLEAHEHAVTEQHFVLRGEYKWGDKLIPEGSYQIFHPHETHGPYESNKGTLILVVWDPAPDEK